MPGVPVKTSRKAGLPWLFKEVHEADSLDELIESVFGLHGRLPQGGRSPPHYLLRSSSERLMCFLFSYVHQTEYFLSLTKQRRMPEPSMAAWDIPEEAIHELVVASLLTRLGSIPQGISHVRRSIELVTEAAFLSTSYVVRNEEFLSPFIGAYLSDAWQQYVAKGQVLHGRTVIEGLKSGQIEIDVGLRDFTTVYLNVFATRLCETHLKRKLRSLTAAGLPEPPFGDAFQTKGPCTDPGCKSPAASLVVDRVPTFDLMTKVTSAKLAHLGYTSDFEERRGRLYDATSSYVHVTREAHHHGPGWTLKETKKWREILNLMLPWIAQALVMLWEFHGIALKGLPEYSKSINHDFGGLNFIAFKKSGKLCGLFLER